jgi:riboflavin synthase
MFTGIVTHQGILTEVKQSSSVYYTIKVDAGFVASLKEGDSISVDGACLTLIEKTAETFTVQLMPETVAKTSFSNSKIGDTFNLELPLVFGGKMDGHLVQGHVDGVGKVKTYTQTKDNWILEVIVPAELRKFIAYKGSITINGVSLTISAKTDEGLQVSLIEYTINNTNLRTLQLGDIVNLEVDVIARYLENMVR